MFIYLFILQAAGKSVCCWRWRHHLFQILYTTCAKEKVTWEIYLLTYLLVLVRTHPPPRAWPPLHILNLCSPLLQNTVPIGSVNSDSFAFWDQDQPPLQIAAAFEGAHYSPDTSLISIMGASTDAADSGDNATCSSPPSVDNACFTVAQMSTLNKTFDKTRLCVFWDVCIEWEAAWWWW